MSGELPFIVEYAKSGRASCKKCKGNIGKDDLRMGILLQSHTFDGKMLLWHHMNCFFEQKNSLKSTAEIANYSNLRWDDQEKVQKYINEKPSQALSETNSSDKSTPPEFMVERAKSSRSTCRNCGEKIKMGVLRIYKLDDNPMHRSYGPTFLWHHAECFVKVKDDLDYNGTADKLPGYDTLSAEEQQNLVEIFTSIEKKRKAEDDGMSPTKIKKAEENEKVLKEQNNRLFQMRDQLKASLSKQDVQKLLLSNNQQLVPGENQLLDHLTDCLVFGALKICPMCGKDAPYFSQDQYICGCSLSDGTKCDYKARYPEREEFVVSEEMRTKFSFLENYKCVVQRRQLPEATEKDKTNLPLGNMNVAVFGKFNIPIDVVKKKVQDLGVCVQHKVDDSLHFSITTQKELELDSLKIQKARKYKIPLLSYDFAVAVKEGKNVLEAANENLISSWDEDLKVKLGEQ